MRSNGQKIISELVAGAIKERHLKKVFVPGEAVVQVTGKDIGGGELTSTLQANSDFWLTSGP